MNSKRTYHKRTHNKKSKTYDKIDTILLVTSLVLSIMYLYK